MFNLMPKDTVFYDLFEGLASHAVSCAGHLHKLATAFPNGMEEIQRIRQEEHDADQLTHQALERLDRTFITPFDREDIHALVGELDSIVDNINALAKRLALYHVKSLEPAFVKQAEILMQATVAPAGGGEEAAYDAETSPTCRARSSRYIAWRTSATTTIWPPSPNSSRPAPIRCM